MRELEASRKRGVSPLVEWCYEEGDEEMEDIGHDFEDLTNLKFYFLEMPLEEF